MELKDYQQTALAEVKRYLTLLVEWREKNRKVIQAAGEEAAMDVPRKAWDALENGRPYISRKNGLKKDVPNFCLKIPTGGGKTLLAVKAIDLINTIVRGRRTGLILWVVPTTQIYRQTLRALRDKEHCYRQHLDIASGGRTTILEKTERFTPLDVEESLCVLLLMLPSASRQSKETLRMFRDSGGFTEFFPLEDNREEHRKILEKIPNLDTFEDQAGFFGQQVKTSLGNTLRLLEPVIILDEGHKAYSDLAQETLRGFNPSLILELSATPPEGSNILVEIFGTDLHREGMIKLDLHILSKASADWHDTLTASVARRSDLERAAEKYRGATGTYIRPICLIQAERVGDDQRGGRWIHAEDVRERLIKIHGIPPEQIALKTSVTDELKEVDDAGGLLSRDCAIRFIITKQALQEGWDCSFAYVLTILTNPASRNSLTQLVGRILRQPYARKTGDPLLDESYVFCFRQGGNELLRDVQRGFREEGLGDLHGRIVADDGTDRDGIGGNEQSSTIRKSFRSASEHVVLPIFVVRDDAGWRPVNIPGDIESRIEWQDACIEKIFALPLGEQDGQDTEHIATLSEDLKMLVEQKNLVRLHDGELHADATFLARHLLDAVSNPWIAYDMGKKIMERLIKKWGEALVTANFVRIIERAGQLLLEEKDRLAHDVFKKLMANGTLRFLVIGNDLGFRLLPKKRTVRSTEWLNRADNSPLQRSLFDPVPSEEFNETERAVAWYLDSHEHLFFWYRNIPRRDYFIQGWRKHRIYPDFIFTTTKDKKAFDRVFVVETKGKHLAGNDDTIYKQSVFGLCNTLAKEGSLNALGLKFKNVDTRFEVIPEREWQEHLQSLVLA